MKDFVIEYKKILNNRVSRSDLMNGVNLSSENPLSKTMDRTRVLESTLKDEIANKKQILIKECSSTHKIALDKEADFFSKREIPTIHPF